MVTLPFQNRSHAGRLLGAKLAAQQLANAVVVALPRGGVPVGAEVADVLQAPLDVLVVRKLGVPWQPELAMGAIAGGTRVLDPQIVRELGITDDEIEDVVAKETLEMKRRQKAYLGDRPPADLEGRTVVLVDDGLATGSTMLAAVRHVRASHPGKLIVAVPVSSREASRRLQAEADGFVCLAFPEPFQAVGHWYADFHQVTDAEVEATSPAARLASASRTSDAR